MCVKCSLDEAEGTSARHSAARIRRKIPAATEYATRVFAPAGFRLNKKYETDFYVEARRESTETYHPPRFQLHIDSQDSPRHNYDTRAKREPSPRTTLSQSEHDWAFAKRALARGDDPDRRHAADRTTSRKRQIRSTGLCPEDRHKGSG